MWLRLTNQPEAICVPGFAFSTRREVTRSRANSPGRCLPGGPFVSAPTTMLQADVARAAVPPCAARAVQPPMSSPVSAIGAFMIRPDSLARRYRSTARSGYRGRLPLRFL